MEVCAHNFFSFILGFGLRNTYSLQSLARLVKTSKDFASKPTISAALLNALYVPGMVQETHHTLAWHC
jgi:hypothetical protein